MITYFLLSFIIGYGIAYILRKNKASNNSIATFDTKQAYTQYEYMREQSKWETDFRNIEYDMEQYRIESKYKHELMFAEANQEYNAIRLMYNKVKEITPLEKLEYIDQYAYYIADYAIKEKNPFCWKLDFQSFIARELGKCFCSRGLIFKSFNTKTRYA